MIRSVPRRLRWPAARFSSWLDTRDTKGLFYSSAARQNAESMEETRGAREDAPPCMSLRISSLGELPSTTPLGVNSANPRKKFRINLEPRWAEDHELVSSTEGIDIAFSGSLVGNRDRKLDVDVTLPAYAPESSSGELLQAKLDSSDLMELTIAVPQRCDLRLVGNTEYFHDVHIGGGQGRIEGDLRVILAYGDISVQKARGKNVELRTAVGGIHVKSVLEGLNTDVSSSDGFQAKRVMGDNVTVRVGGEAGVSIAAAYGNHFFLQSRDGPVSLGTAQVSTLDVRAGGAPGINIGGMSGTLLAHAAPSNGDFQSTKEIEAGCQDEVAINVSFDRVGENSSAMGHGIVKDDARDTLHLHNQERSVLRCDGGGSINVSLSDEQPINLDISLQSGESGVVCLPDGGGGGDYVPGRQAAAGFQANALSENREMPSMETLPPAKTIFEGTVETNKASGWLRSTPRAIGRSGRGGSGKIRVEQGGAEQTEMSSRPQLTALSDGNVSITVAGWMDRIRSKYMP